MKSTAIIVVGDEILSGFTLDTNSHHLATRAFAAGFPVCRIEVIGDDVESIAAAVRRAAADHTVSRVAVCGGVGPTPDDRTHAGVARGLGVALTEHPDALRVIEARIQVLVDAGRLASPTLSSANRRMAMVPMGSQVMNNDDGMAPPVALALPGDDRWLFVLPGVPREFVAIVDDTLMPRFFADGAPPVVVELRYSGIPEAAFADAMTQLAAEFPEVVIGSYPQRTRREVLMRLRGANVTRVNDAAARFAELAPTA